jgi:hydrogenase expression/formation protein HypE
MRDPTRGGLASTLNEIAAQSCVGIRLYEDKIPVHDGVRGACELLGFDPLYIANEGKLVVIAAARDADKLLATMRQHQYGAEAAIIGEITPDHSGKVLLKTRMGASRIVDMLSGELLPRIC